MKLSYQLSYEFGNLKVLMMFMVMNGYTYNDMNSKVYSWYWSINSNEENDQKGILGILG